LKNEEVCFWKSSELTGEANICPEIWIY